MFKKISDGIFKFLLGDDIFISYSRADGATYAAGLASKLADLGFSCKLDQWGTEATNEMPESLKKALRRSAVLVLVGTVGAAKSDHVRDEIAEFKKTKRMIIPIVFDGVLLANDFTCKDGALVYSSQLSEEELKSLTKAKWAEEIVGLPISVEKTETLKSGVPAENSKNNAEEKNITPIEIIKENIKQVVITDGIVSRIKNTFTFSRKDERLRKTSMASAILLILLLTATAGAGIAAYIQTNTAIAATTRATEKTIAAEEATNKANFEANRAIKNEEIANKRTEEVRLKTIEANDAIKLADDKTKVANTAGELAKEKTKEANAATKLAKDKTEEATKATETARQQTELAKQAEGRAKDALLLQERAQEQFNSQQLAVEALREFPDHPQNALNLAVKAVEMNSKSGETVPEAETALRWLLGQIGGEPLGQHKEKVTALDISSDGRWIATSGADGEVRLWDTSSRKIISGEAIITNINSEQENNTGYEIVDFGASFVKFSPDNKWLVVLKIFRFEQEYSKGIYLLNLETENISSKSLVNLSNIDEELISISWSGTGKWLITGHSEGTVNFWKPGIPGNLPKYSFKAAHGSGVNAITASSDGRLVATSSEYEMPKLWKLEDKPALSEVQYKLNLNPEPLISKRIITVSFSNDGQVLITGIKRGEDGNYTHQVVFWRTDKDENIGATDVPLSVDDALLSPDEKWLVVRGTIYYRGGSSTNALRLYAVEKSLDETQSEADSSESKDNSRYKFKLAEEQPLNTPIENVQLSHDGKWLIMSATDNIARLWHLEDSLPWNHEVELVGHDNLVTLISTNKEWLITGSGDGTARRWNLQVIKPQKEPINTEDPFDINLSPDRIAITNNGKWLAASTRILLDSQEVYVWDLTNLKRRAAFSAAFFEDGSAKEIQFSKNGKWLIVWDNNSETSWLYAEPFDEEPFKLKGRFIEMSDSSRWLLTANNKENKETYLWDLKKPNWKEYPSSITGSALQAKFIEQSNKMITISNISNQIGKDVRVFNSLDSVPQQVNQFFTGGDTRTLTDRWLVSNDQLGQPSIWSLETNDKNPRFILKDSFLRYSGVYQIDEINGLLVTYDNTPSDDLEEVKNLQIYNLKSMERTISPKIYKGSASIRITASAPNLLFAGTDDGTINVWDLRQTGKTSEPHYKLSGHGQRISALHVSADNNYLISGGWDGTVRSWNIKLLAEQESALSSVIIGKHRNPIDKIKLMPVDNRIIVQPENESLKIYTFDLKTLVERAKEITGRNSGVR